MRVRFCLREILAMQNNIRAQFLAIAYFDERRVLGHDHCRRNAEQFSLIRERLSVVAGGSSDHAPFFLIG